MALSIITKNKNKKQSSYLKLRDAQLYNEFHKNTTVEDLHFLNSRKSANQFVTSSDILGGVIYSK